MTRLRLALVAAALAGVLAGCGDSGATVTAQFRDGAGLFEGNDVGVLGVQVGEVKSITPRGDHVDVVLQIDPGVRLPADVGAVVVSRSVATDRYVEMTPVYTSGPTLADGATLTLARTRTPVEFDELLGSLRNLSDNLGGDGTAQPLNHALRTTAKAMDGNGARLAGALHDLATTLEAANASSGDFAGTVRNLDKLTATLATNDRLVRRFNEDLADAMGLLDDQSGAIEAAFEALTAMVKKVTAFVRSHRGQIDSQVDDIRRIVAALIGDKDNLTEVLETFPLALQNGQRAIDPDTHRLNFLLRPGDLAPTEAGLQILCANFPPGSCDAFTPGAQHLFDLFRLLAGLS